MSSPILKTKLYIPPLRPVVVRRPRLVTRLDAALRYKLTLISAPAGFGKTTLLSEWVHDGDASVAWISLDEGDNDPERFLRYLIAALQQIDPGLGSEVLEALQGAQLPSLPRYGEREPSLEDRGVEEMPPWLEAALVGLLNEVDALSSPFVLVLDDYHLITAPHVHGALVFLLRHQPPQMHLIVSSRVDPPLSLSRLRGRGQLNELRGADLRFTREEVAAFFRQMIGRMLPAEDVAAIEARTEGWAVGLQMAALSMQDQDAHDVASFIDAFTGSHRYVLDYLTDEVLLRQPEQVQRFLLRTSVLDRLTASLCDLLFRDAEPSGTDVSSSQESQRILEYLDRSNLFVVPLDDQREWYRYHQLFRGLLRRRLRRTDAALAPLLYRRASAWFEREGQIVEAVHYGVEAGDTERVARLIERDIPAILDRGELPALVRWLDTLPEEELHGRPWLCVAYAWTLAYAGALGDAEALLQDAEAAVSEQSSIGLTAIDGHLAAIRAYAAWVEGDHVRAAEQARLALERARDEGRVVRGFAANALGSALVECGDLAGAEQALTEAIELAGRDTHVGLLAAASLADVLARQGRLTQAARVCRDALGATEEAGSVQAPRLPAAGNTMGMMSAILRERNELEEAARLAEQGVALGERWGQADTITFCSVQLAQAREAAGDERGASAALERAREVAERVSPWFEAIVDVTQAKFDLARGDVDAVVRWAHDAGIDTGERGNLREYYRYRMLAQLSLAQQHSQQALALLGAMATEIEAAGAYGLLIEVLGLEAMALRQQGNEKEALGVLERAIRLAEPEGFVRSFVEKGAPMRDLLELVQRRQVMPEYVARLLAAYTPQAGQEPAVAEAAVPGVVPPGASGASQLLEPLSDRELEILGLLALGLTNREVGERLYIAPGTVKAHTASIYGKLDVHSRMQAVARARELGILPLPR
ncbi:MAG TPA: LuxR C-terminal-related transcriptional regulator [Anaerolineae bacterium]|nr:LuxR C-terminal-related transcriptional regulator [Anaerolineae bacterium]